jgi:serine/threonine protein kinase
LPPGRTLRYAAQIADALARAHKFGITLRNLKPANVMLTKGGTKLMDFCLRNGGSVRPLDSGATYEKRAQVLHCRGEGAILRRHLLDKVPVSDLPMPTSLQPLWKIYPIKEEIFRNQIRCRNVLIKGCQGRSICLRKLA